MKKTSFLILSLLLFIFACTNNKNQQEKSNGELQELKLGVMSSMDYIPFVVAQKKGIYDTLGVKVNIIKFFSANERDAAFQSGYIDGTVIDFTGAAIQQANGIDLGMIMKNDGYFYFIAAKGTHIDSISQLRGKNIAVSRNTVIEFFTDKILESANIRFTEINKPEINKIPLRLEMFQNKQIDASIFPDPFATIAINNGNKSLITTKELGISAIGTVFIGKALKEKRNEIKLLIQGYNVAVDYIKTHPIEEWSDILVEDGGVPSSMINQINLPEYQHASLPTNKDIHLTILWLKNKNLIPADYNGNYLVDTTFISPSPIACPLSK